MLKLGNEEFVFLFFGIIRPFKGVFRLIDTFGRLRSRQIRLLVAGQPSNEMSRVELIEHCQLDDRILTSLQKVPVEDVQLYMNAADVVVLPYQDTLTSGSVLLAMSFGKAVIMPRIGCIPEVVDSQGGFLYSPHDEEGLLRAMQQALSADTATMGKYNYARAQSFDWVEIAQETCVVYCRC